MLSGRKTVGYWYGWAFTVLQETFISHIYVHFLYKMDIMVSVIKKKIIKVESYTKSI